MTIAPKPKPKKSTSAKPMIGKAVAAMATKPRATAASVAKVTLPPVAAVAVPRVALVATKGKADADVKVLRKNDLVDKVMAISGAKKAMVRDIVEATLTVLGEALSKGATLNLPPLGKARVSRPADAGSSKAMTVKLRRGSGGGQSAGKAKQALAQSED